MTKRFKFGETRLATRDVGFLDAAAREAARGAVLIDAAVRLCATAGFRIVVSEKSGGASLVYIIWFHRRCCLQRPGMRLKPRR
jgi:hypothetical protein